MGRLACMLCTLLAAACSGAAVPAAPLAVSLDGAGGGPAAAALRDALDRSPLFRLEDGDAAHRAEVRVVEVGGEGERGLRLDVRIEDPAAPDGAWRAVVEVWGDRGRAPAPSDARLAAERAVAVLEARRLLATGRREAVGRVVAADDPEIAALALEWIRDHRPGAYADVTVPFLASDDPRLVRLSAEILGRAGDPAYVSVLLDAAARAGEGPRRAIYDALGRIGGGRAERFLALAADNEDSAEMAAAARRALERARGPRPPALSADLGPDLRRGHR